MFLAAAFSIWACQTCCCFVILHCEVDVEFFWAIVILLCILQFGVYGPAGLQQIINGLLILISVYLNWQSYLHFLWAFLSTLFMFFFSQKMMTRQSKVAPTVSAVKTVHPRKVQKRVAKPAKGAPKAKRVKTTKTATPHIVQDNASAQLNQAVHVPMVSEVPRPCYHCFGSSARGLEGSRVDLPSSTAIMAWQRWLNT